MKIILSAINSKYIHSTLAPWCIKAGIEAFCTGTHCVTVTENTINEPIEKILTTIISEKPDIIGFSCYIWNIEYIIKLASLIKENTNTIIILGGPEVQFRDEAILNEYSFIDYVVKGEGEWTFSSFVECIENNSGFDNCEGLSYRSDDGIISNPEKFHYETPPSPYCDEYFNCLNGRISYIESSRGCPFNCAYCLSGRLGKIRYFDSDVVNANILKLATSGTKTVKFIDRTFNADESKAIRTIEFIRDNYGKAISEGICFHFEFAGDIISDKLFNVLKPLPEGLIQLEIGIQSFNENTLKAINRRSDLNKLKANLIRLIKLKTIHIHIDLIAGLPFEDLASFRDSFNEAFSLKADMLQPGFLKLLNGSPLDQMKSEYDYKFSKNPPYEIINNCFISFEDIRKLKACEAALDRLYNSGRFLFTLEYLFDCLKMNPFDTFVEFGLSADFNNISLKDFVIHIFEYFSDKCDPLILRETILCDLATVSVNIKIPDCLSVYEKEYKSVKKLYSEKLGKKVNVVILRSCSRVFVSHPDRPNQLNGRFYYELYDM